MTETAYPTSETRLAQRYPRLTAEERTRIAGFATPARFAAGESIVAAGESGHGLFVVLSGEAEVTRRSDGTDTLVTVHTAGEFIGEIAQLSGRAALFNARARTAVETLVIPPERLRALLVAEAELGERIMRALILRRVSLIEWGAGGPIIVGGSESADVLRLAGFLRRNGHPHQQLDPRSDPEAETLLARFAVSEEELPIVLCPSGQLLRNPTEHDLAVCLGMVSAGDPSKVYDVAIVGSGPAGLAAAVYAGSEGLSAIVLDCRAFGGQAGASARIENYFGFPTGISGLALTARAYNQAQKFGVEFAIPEEVVGIETQDGTHMLSLASGGKVRARAVVVANGVDYRRLAVPRLDEFEGSGIHYWASPLEGKLCSGAEVVLVGAGNSAGQAVVYLASMTERVRMLVRGGDLSASMSRYLVDRITALPNVEVTTRANVTGLEGEAGLLRAVQWDCPEGTHITRTRHLFLFIGAEPRTGWLAGSGVGLDKHGFILTGTENGGLSGLATSVPGIYAIGDVRAGSTKRVAAAVGEGAQVVAALHAQFRLASVLPQRAA